MGGRFVIFKHLKFMQKQEIFEFIISMQDDSSSKQMFTNLNANFC